MTTTAAGFVRNRPMGCLPLGSKCGSMCHLHTVRLLIGLVVSSLMIQASLNPPGLADQCRNFQDGKPL